MRNRFSQTRATAGFFRNASPKPANLFGVSSPMVIDNQIYSQIADTWWTEDSVLCLLRMHVNPCRFAYFREILDRMSVNPSQCRVLDIGCGGGFLSEEFARLGCRVVGVDPVGRIAGDRSRACRNQWLRYRLPPRLRGAVAV